MSRIVFLAVLVGAVFCSADLIAQTEETTQEVDMRIDTAAGTQQQLNDWSTEREQVEARYRTAKLNISQLKDRLGVAESRADLLRSQVEELERRLGEAGRLKATINDTMQVVLSRLEKAVEADQPFLVSERRQRLDDLRTLLVDDEVIEAEKLRRLLEALLVEAKYGETVEVTQESIDLNGQEVFVDLLRVGRMSLFFMTPDKTLAGSYDPARQKYVELTSDNYRRIDKAMEMASNMRPVELLSLPLGRIER